MNTKTIEARLTSLEERKRSRSQGEQKPDWWADVPDDLKVDVEHMERMVEEAGGKPVSDPFVLRTANRLATFISAWNNDHSH